jgi:hypothetical protein
VCGELRLLEDVGKVAAETFEAKKSLIYVRSVARAIAKGLAAHELKKKADEKTENRLVRWLKKAAIDVGTDIIENADLRCSRLLPGRILVGDFEMDPGIHAVTVEIVGVNGSVQRRFAFPEYQVKSSGFNFIKVIALD